VNLLTEKLKEFGMSTDDLNLIESTIQTRVDEAAQAKATELLEAERQTFQTQIDTIVESFSTKIETLTAEITESTETKYAAKIAEHFESAKSEAQAIVEAFEEKFDRYSTTLIEALEQKYQDSFKDEAQAIFESFQNRFDAYSKHITEQLQAEYRTPDQLKVDLAESMLESIRSVYSAHNIALPESVDFQAEYNSFVTESESQIRQLEKENNGLKRAINEQARTNIVESVTAGMTVIQKDTFETLIESVVFTDNQAYTDRLNTLKQKFLSTSASTTDMTESTADTQTQTNQTTLNESSAKPKIDVSKYTKFSK